MPSILAKEVAETEAHRVVERHRGEDGETGRDELLLGAAHDGGSDGDDRDHRTRQRGDDVVNFCGRATCGRRRRRQQAPDDLDDRDEHRDGVHFKPFRRRRDT